MVYDKKNLLATKQQNKLNRNGYYEKYVLKRVCWFSDDDGALKMYFLYTKPTKIVLFFFKLIWLLLILTKLIILE